jgi:hypothetical protein
VVEGVGQIDGLTGGECGWKDQRLDRGRRVMQLKDWPMRLMGQRANAAYGPMG